MTNNYSTGGAGRITKRAGRLTSQRDWQGKVTGKKLTADDAWLYGTSHPSRDARYSDKYKQKKHNQDDVWEVDELFTK